jgi:hypothetical protein
MSSASIRRCDPSPRRGSAKGKQVTVCGRYRNQINERRRAKTMKTLNSVVCASGIAIAMLTSSVAIAESAEQEAAVNKSNSGTQVHRVSHALAASSTYQASGYKWGKESSADQNKSQSQWGQNSAKQSGNKWGSSAVSSDSTKPVYATTSGSRWGLNNYSDQAGSRWGLNSYSNQAGSRWGLN